MMDQDNLLTIAVANLAAIPFRLFSQRPFEQPTRILILKPCCLSQVMLATPLLAILNDAYPNVKIDWAVSEWARPALRGNPRINELIDTGNATLAVGTWADTQSLIERLRQGEYDTCFVPARATLLSYIAWRAGIRQRIGLNANGRGFAHTLPVELPKDQVREAEIYLSLARAVGLDGRVEMEFYPADDERSGVTDILYGEVGWDGIRPLAIIHPGGGSNPIHLRPDLRWPEERLALLASRLSRMYGAQVILVASDSEKGIADNVIGLMSKPVTNLAGRLTLGEIGALCEVADLYVGNDTGPTHIAAAMGCPTLAIFGPTDPVVSAPFSDNGKVRVVQAEGNPSNKNDFSWDNGPSADQVLAAADALLGLPPDHLTPDP